MSLSSQEAFPTTGWSHVQLAGGASAKARAALNELCRKYWRPLYAFIRHRGYGPHDAEDMAQAYFADLLNRGYIERADKTKGRFRTFLIHDLKFFMNSDRARAQAKKRGGGLVFIPIDAAAAEASQQEYGTAPNTEPDAWFDRQWALETVKLAREAVALEYANDGRHHIFTVLQSGLVNPPNADTYARWEQETGKTVNALKVALHRLRERFREALQRQIMQTVCDESEMKDEMRHLLQALSRD